MYELILAWENLNSFCFLRLHLVCCLDSSNFLFSYSSKLILVICLVSLKMAIGMEIFFTFPRILTWQTVALHLSVFYFHSQRKQKIRVKIHLQKIYKTFSLKIFLKTGPKLKTTNQHFHPFLKKLNCDDTLE